MALSDGTVSLQMAMDLLEGLEQDALFLAYQPVYEVRTGRPRGVEALLRWRHESRGVLLPGAFLPPDLGTGIGAAITDFVLQEAIAQCSVWRHSGLDITVAVNVWPAGLTDDVVPETVADLLRRYDVPADHLTIEVTEQACNIDPGAVRETFTALARIGVRLSLDDFGLGDSSLSRLQQLHFDELKIDRSFVKNALTEPTDRNIIEFSTQLAHSLGIQVVAEGVESETVLELLADLDVDFAQGFHMQRPTAPASIASLFASA
jgi:EAL domain-containing protein (putative c-di-GMP-specific phosphodiesterase class I)